jgi:acetyltransferase-like isoleucine patch superfamily enzyme
MFIVDAIATRLRGGRGRRARALVLALFRIEAPPLALYRWLAAERFGRRLLVRHLVRALYHQPILRSMCTRAGERLFLDPGKGVPVFYGVDVELGDGVHLSGKTTISGALRPDSRRPRFIVGDESYLGHYLNVTLDDEIRIGRHVRISSHVFLCGYDAHPRDPIARRSRAAPVAVRGESRIVIDDDVWVGDGALILKGVRIGAGAIVAAHSVVTEDVAPGTVVAGNPARQVGQVDQARAQRMPTAYKTTVPG